MLHSMNTWITKEPYLQCGDDHQSPSVDNTPLSFTWVHILNMTWSAICVKPLLFTCMGLGSQRASSPWAIPPRRASKRGESPRASPEGLPTMAREDITAALVWPSSPQPRSGCTWMGRNSVLEIIFLIFQQDVTSPHCTQDWQRQPWVIDLDWERYPRRYDSTRPLPPQHKSIQTC